MWPLCECQQLLQETSDEKAFEFKRFFTQKLKLLVFLFNLKIKAK